MKGDISNPEKTRDLEPNLAEVAACIAEALSRTPLSALPGGVPEEFSGGKMLRSRLVLRMAPACGAAPSSARRAAAAVELVHAASLLHDDVIDGGYLRRAAPAFWVRHGVQAAILVGDLLLCEAGRLLEAPEEGERLRELIARTRDVCRAEVEQELFLRGAAADWDTALRLARQKTGALFAFCAAAACRPGSPQDALRSALREAGYRAGTAYQLTDDFLDAMGDRNEADKTLGLDGARRKVTAVAAAEPEDIEGAVNRLEQEAKALLAPFPDASNAWHTYWTSDLRPVLDRHLQPAALSLA